jgi:hypothetical protein
MCARMILAARSWSRSALVVTAFSVTAIACSSSSNEGLGDSGVVIVHEDTGTPTIPHDTGTPTIPHDTGVVTTLDTGTGQPDTGTGDDTDGGGSCGQFSTGIAACDTCLAGSCCSQEAACSNDSTCTSCVTTDPSTSACEANQNEVGFLECAQGACMSECFAASDGGTATGDAGGACGFTTMNAACDSCIGSSCCGQATACASDSACATCAGDPSGAGCSTQQDFSAFESCISSSCATQCTAS